MDPAMDIPTVVSHREDTVNLAEPSPPESGIDNAIVPDRIALKEGDWTYATRFSRMENVSSFVWSSSAHLGSAIFFQPVTNLIWNASRTKVRDTFRLWRFDSIDISFHMNVNEFYSGHAKAVFIPGDLTTANINTAYYKSGFHLMASESPNLTMNIPWNHIKHFFDDEAPFHKDKIGLGTLAIMVFDPLAGPAEAIQQIDVRVLSSINGMRFAFPIAPYQLPVEGYEEIRYFPNTENYLGLKDTTRMAGNHVMMNGCGLSESGMSTSLAYLLHQEQHILALDWTTAMTPLQILATVFVTPKSASQIQGGGPILFEDLHSMLATMFNYWSGAMAYHMVVSKTTFHTGKLAVYACGAGTPASADFTQHPHVIYDIKKGCICKFAVPPTWDFPLKTLWTDDNKLNSPIQFRIVVHTPLRTTVALKPSVRVSVFRLSYFKNPLRFFTPCSQSVQIQGVTTALMCDDHYDILGEEASSISTINGSFEEIVDLRQLTCRMNSFYFGWKQDHPNVRIPMDIPVRPDLYDIALADIRPECYNPALTKMFSFWGGSMNYMVQANAPVLEVRISPPVVGANDPAKWKENFPYYRGCIRPTQNLINTVSYVTFSVPDSPLNECNFITTGNEPYVTHNQVVKLFSYETLNHTQANEYLFYYSTGPDFWMSGYRGISECEHLMRYAMGNYIPQISLGYGFWEFTPSAPFKPHATAEEALAFWKARLKGRKHALPLYNLVEMMRTVYADDEIRAALQKDKLKWPVRAITPAPSSAPPTPALPHLPNWPHNAPGPGIVEGLLDHIVPFSKEVALVAGGIAIAGGVYASTRHAVSCIEKFSTPMRDHVNSTLDRVDDTLEVAAATITRMAGVPTDKISSMILLIIDAVESCVINTNVKWGFFITKFAITTSVNVGFLKTAFSHVLRFSNQSAQESELQGALDFTNKSIINLLTIAVIAVGFTASGGTNVDEKKCKTIFDYLSVRGRDLINIKGGISALATCFSSIKEMVGEALFESGILDTKEDFATDDNKLSLLMKPFIEKLEEMTGTTELLRKCATDPTHRAQYATLYADHTKISNFILNHKIQDRQLIGNFQILSKRMDRVHDMIFELSELNDFRIDPFHICLSGEPGIGKGGVLYDLANSIADVQKVPKEGRMFQRTLGMEFCDNYHGQFSFINDEADQVDDPKETAATIQYKSNIPVSMNMANLARKGMWFSSKLMLSNTNNPYPSPNAIKEKSAYWRRRNLLWQVTRKTGTTFRDDMSEFEFFRLNPNRAQDRREGPFSITEFLFECNHAYASYMLNQNKLLTRMGITSGLTQVFRAPEHRVIKKWHKKKILDAVDAAANIKYVERDYADEETDSEDEDDYRNPPSTSTTLNPRERVQQVWNARMVEGTEAFCEDASDDEDDEPLIQALPKIGNFDLQIVGTEYYLLERRGDTWYTVPYTHDSYDALYEALFYAMDEVRNHPVLTAEEKQRFESLTILLSDGIRRTRLGIAKGKKNKIPLSYHTSLPVEGTNDLSYRFKVDVKTYDDYNYLSKALCNLHDLLSKLDNKYFTGFRLFQTIVSFSVVILCNHFSTTLAELTAFAKTKSTAWRCITGWIFGNIEWHIGECIKEYLARLQPYYWMLAPILAALIGKTLHYGFLYFKKTVDDREELRNKVNCLTEDCESLIIMTPDHPKLPDDGEKHLHGHFCTNCHKVFTHMHKFYKNSEPGKHHTVCHSCKHKHRLHDESDFERETDEMETATPTIPPTPPNTPEKVEGYAKEKGAKPKLQVTRKVVLEGRAITGTSPEENPVIPGFPKDKPDEALAQGCSDQSYNSISSKIYSNCGIISTGLRTLNYLGLKSHYLIVNRHLLEGSVGRKIPIMLTRKETEFTIMVGPEDFIFWADLKNPETGENIKNDRMIISLERFPTIPRFADIMNHISSVDDLLRAHETPAMLVTTEHFQRENCMRRDLFIPRLLAQDGTYFKGILESFATWKTWRYEIPTQPGMCGSFVMSMNPAMPAKLVGIHMAGPKKDDIGYASVLWREEIEFHLPKHHKEFNEAEIQGATLCEMTDLRLYPEGDVYYDYAELDGPPTISPLKTDLRTSPLYDKIFPHTTEPSLLHGNDPRNESGTTPMKLGLNKFKSIKEFPADIRQIVVDDYVAEIVELTKGKSGPRRTLTMQEAINGIPGILDPMKFDTSPGFPFTRIKKGKGRKFLFESLGFSSTGQELFKPGPLLQNKLDITLRKARLESIHYENYFVDQLKDERRPIAKVRQAKTRVFNMHNVAWLILNRMYLGAFVETYNQIGILAGNGLALNPEGADATELIKYLSSVGNNYYDGDFSAWDGTFDSSTIHMMADVIYKWYEWVAPETDLQMVWMCLTSLFDRVHICGKTVYKLNTGMPSGHYITGTGNTVGHNCRDRCLWLIMTRAIRPALASMSAFKTHVRTVKTGDDSIGAVSKQCKDFWNPEMLCKMYKAHGIVYTPPQKEEGVTFENGGFVKLEELSFLKRTFKEDERFPGYYHAGMNKTMTIQELVNWIRSGQPPKEALSSNIEDALRFAFGHGREYFDEFLGTLKPFLQEEGMPPPRVSWTQLDYEWQVANGLL
jgi:hypothetical protein